MAVMAAVVIVAYILYTVSPDTIQIHGTDRLYLTGILGSGGAAEISATCPGGKLHRVSYQDLAPGPVSPGRPDVLDPQLLLPIV